MRARGAESGVGAFLPIFQESGFVKNDRLPTLETSFRLVQFAVLEVYKYMQTRAFTIDEYSY